MKMETLVARLKGDAAQLDLFVQDHQIRKGKESAYFAALETVENSSDPADLARAADELFKNCDLADRYDARRFTRLSRNVGLDGEAIQRLLKYGTSVTLIGEHEAREIRAKKTQYGSVDLVVTKRSVVCRSCGRNIPKGTEALSAGWDMGGCGSWTATTIFIHKDPCENIMDKMEQADRLDSWTRQYTGYTSFEDLCKGNPTLRPGSFPVVDRLREAFRSRTGHEAAV